jgi:putative endonuclease
VSGSWQAYLLYCADGKIYTGAMNDLEKRLEAHNKGFASMFTRAKLPVTVLAACRALAKEDAFRPGYRIERLPRTKKLQALKDG